MYRVIAGIDTCEDVFGYKHSRSKHHIVVEGKVEGYVVLKPGSGTYCFTT